MTKEGLIITLNKEDDVYPIEYVNNLLKESERLRIVLEELKKEKFPTGICIDSLANEKAIKILEKVILCEGKNK